MEEETLMEERKAFWQLFKEGQTCEVCKMDNDLIFLGKLHLTHERAVIDVSDANGHFLPPVMYSKKFKIKLYLEGGCCLLEASVCGSSKEFWRFEHLRPLFDRESRRYFRQRVDVKTILRQLEADEIRQMKEAGRVRMGSGVPEVEGTNCHLCTMEDLGLGGTQIRCATELEVGNWVEISNVTLAREMPFTFIGQIRWKREGEEAMPKKPKENRYGCQFDLMSEREQDRLFRAIMSVQRELLNERRESAVKRI